MWEEIYENFKKTDVNDIDLSVLGKHEQKIKKDKSMEKLVKTLQNGETDNIYLEIKKIYNSYKTSKNKDLSNCFKSIIEDIDEKNKNLKEFEEEIKDFKVKADKSNLNAIVKFNKADKINKNTYALLDKCKEYKKMAKQSLQEAEELKLKIEEEEKFHEDYKKDVQEKMVEVYRLKFKIQKEFKKTQTDNDNNNYNPQTLDGILAYAIDIVSSGSNVSNSEIFESIYSELNNYISSIKHAVEEGRKIYKNIKSSNPGRWKESMDSRLKIFRDSLNLMKDELKSAKNNFKKISVIRKESESAFSDILSCKDRISESNKTVQSYSLNDKGTNLSVRISSIFDAEDKINNYIINLISANEDAEEIIDKWDSINKLFQKRL